MKTRFLSLLGILAALSTGFADDVAVLDIRKGKEKALQRVVIELNENAAPNTVANFKKLVNSKFYNGTAFHRVFPSQMVQAGDPNSRGKDRRNIGTGGPGYTIPPEINKAKHVPGTVAMARLPDKINPDRVSNGSQFYITLAPMPALDGKYTVFGKVIEGLDVVEAISQNAADTNDNPITKITIASAQIVPREVAEAVKPKGGGFLKIFRR